MTRRRLIETGLGGAALLVAAGCTRSKGSAPAFDDPQYHYAVLSAGDRAMLAAIAAVMLAGALPQTTTGVPAIVQVVRGIDVAVAGLSPDVQGEVSQLFGLLEFPLTRALAAGIWSSWSDAGSDAITKFLDGWRYSGIALFRSGYQALHQLVMAAWYGNSAAWPRIGYSGPPTLS